MEKILNAIAGTNQGIHNDLTLKSEGVKPNWEKPDFKPDLSLTRLLGFEDEHGKKIQPSQETSRYYQALQSRIDLRRLGLKVVSWITRYSNKAIKGGDK